jgi:hypothetical protein
MFNPEPQTFDDPEGFVRAMRQEFPEVKVAPPWSEAEECDVCEGGALLLYRVRHGLVDADVLMKAINGDDDDEDLGLDERPDDDGVVNEEWRFPVPQILQVVLVGLKPRLDEQTATQLAFDIVAANDKGDFGEAEALIEKALRWPE